MDVRSAVTAAKKFLGEIFTDEQICNVRLEEVEHDDSSNNWLITLGFNRILPIRQGLISAIGVNIEPILEPREYKVVRISDPGGQLVSIKNRESIDAS
jgi:hypothetical protein